MHLVKNRNSVAAIVSLVLALISCLSCMLVISSIVLYPRAKESYHLQLVNRLLISDFGLSFSVVFYYVIQYALNTDQLKQVCKIYLPVILYFFVTSYCCTIILALRFRTLNDMNAQRKAWVPPIGLNYVWIFPLFCSIPIFISAWATNDVTTVHVNDSDTNQVCTFNHDSILGESLDLVFFQLPLLMTIIINGYSYIKGVRALRNSPHSVVARQMRRAGGYILVLLVVWVPNIAYNMLSIFVGNNDSFSALLDLAVFLTSSQGFFDVAVYVYSNQQMRKWLYRNLVFFRIGQNGGQDAGAMTNSSGSRNSKGPSGSEGDSDDEDDGNMWLSTSQSFSGQSASEASSAITSNITNPINASAIKNIDSPIKTKSILVGAPGISHNAPLGAHAHGNSGRGADFGLVGSVEIDHEKFVRFGE